MLVGFALLIAGGITAYPSIRDSLGLAPTPNGFGDEGALEAGILEVNEALPPASGATTGSPPSVLPETPLESDPQATLPPQPTLEPTVTPAPLPTATVPAATFVPEAPSRLVIPAIDLDAPVESVGWLVTTQSGQQVSMWDVPNKFAAGWLRTSAKLGEPGNTVLDGHHNIYGEVFRELVNLEEGDEIQVWTGNRSRDYVVSLLKILPERGQPISVRLENAKWIQPTEDERLTLVTCWPYTNNTHRLVVVALPADEMPPPAGVEE